MAQARVLVSEQLERALARAFPGQWSLLRDPGMEDAYQMAYRCSARGTLVFSSTLFEDARAPFDHVVDSAGELYDGLHRRSVSQEAERLVPCRRCNHVNVVPDTAKLPVDEQFADAERMSLLWMERANSIRRLWFNS